MQQKVHKTSNDLNSDKVTIKTGFLPASCSRLSYECRPIFPKIIVIFSNLFDKFYDLK
jgi:hypothetical protein